MIGASLCCWPAREQSMPVDEPRDSSHTSLSTPGDAAVGSNVPKQSPASRPEQLDDVAGAVVVRLKRTAHVTQILHPARTADKV